EQIGELRSRQSRLQRIRNAIAPVSRWKKARHDLQGLQDVPLLSEEFAETCNQTLVDLRKAEQQQEDASRTLAQLTEELDRIEVPVELLREADSLERLRDRLGGHSKAMVDRPGLDALRLKH